MTATITITFDNDEDEPVSHELPAKHVVCSNCEGHGMVLNESMRGYAYTESDEEFHDPEFRREYFKRGGIYDVQCPTCKGLRVVLKVDTALLTADQKAVYKRHRDIERDNAAYDDMCRREREMGA